MEDMISTANLREVLSCEGNCVIVDIREAYEFELKTIPLARNIPLGELEERYSELEDYDSVFVLCNTGSRSIEGARILKEKGLSSVKSIEGGMSDWVTPTDVSVMRKIKGFFKK